MKRFLNNSHFETLGVTPYSTQDEIKKAYREQMKKWHPDRFSNEPDRITEALERSKKINEAFSFLEKYIPPTKSSISTDVSKHNTKSQTSSRQTNATQKSSRLNIQRIRVKSSNIHSIGYDVASKTLQVEFLNGNIYQYCNVPVHVYNELMKSTSKGKYFNSKIAFCFDYECV